MQNKCLYFIFQDRASKMSNFDWSLMKNRFPITQINMRGRQGIYRPRTNQTYHFLIFISTLRIKQEYNSAGKLTCYKNASIKSITVARHQVTGSERQQNSYQGHQVQWWLEQTMRSMRHILLTFFHKQLVFLCLDMLKYH